MDLAPHCPEPDGGWQPADLSTTTGARLRQALEMGQTLNGYAGAWVNEASLGGDPIDTLLNVRTTGDLAVAEQAIREVWSGRVCVEGRAHRRRLERIQSELMDQRPSLGIGIAVPTGQVILRVIVATTQDQARLDDTYGVGVVRLQGELVPLTGTSR